MFKLTLARRRVFPKLWKLPRVDLPRVRVDFPEKVPPPWQQIEVDTVIFAQLNPETFIVRVIFG